MVSSAAQVALPFATNTTTQVGGRGHQVEKTASKLRGFAHIIAKKLGIVSSMSSAKRSSAFTIQRCPKCHRAEMQQNILRHQHLHPPNPQVYCVHYSPQNRSTCVLFCIILKNLGRGGGPSNDPLVAMRSLNWNCQGCGRASTVQQLQDLLDDTTGIGFFFRNGFNHCSVVFPTGSSGGLLLEWRGIGAVRVVVTCQYLILVEFGAVKLL